MKIRIILVLLALALTACTSAQPVDIQGTAVALAVTEIHLTQSALPTSTPTVIATVETILPTPYPTQPHPPIFTPDATQVERWKEYQAALAKALFSFDPDHSEGYDPEAYKTALCEWDILGQAKQEVYVWADCISADGLALQGNPAVIHLNPDETIQEVIEVKTRADPNTQLAIYDLHLFPINLQEKLCLHYFFGTVPQCVSIVANYLPRSGLSEREGLLISHLKYRQKHVDERPLVVLSATPKP